MDRENPRKWYSALMDLGVRLKKMYPNPSRRSAHYSRQSAFEGSNRQIRGAILKYIITNGSSSKTALKNNIPAQPERFDEMLDALIAEGFLVKKNRRYYLNE